MRGLITRSGAGTALVLLILAAASPARGETVPLHTVPKPVLDAVMARFKGARIARAEKDRVGGGFVYEVTIKHQGQSIDATLTPEGTMLLIKKEIAAADLPPPVAKAVADAYPTATLQVVEAVIRVQGRHETLVSYEVNLVTAQRKLVEMRMSADGKLLGGER